MNKFSFLDYNFIVKDADESGNFTLLDAKDLCSRIGGGWRVPTLPELELIYNESLIKGISTFTQLKFHPTNYLTDSVDDFDGWPLSFDFNDGVSYLSSEKSKHSLRLVRDEVVSAQASSMTQADFIQKAISVLRAYVPTLDTKKMEGFLLESLEFNATSYDKIRYVTLEDENMCMDPEEFYAAHFHEDNDLVSIWEDDYYASGYNADELDDEEEGLRAGFIGFLDIFDQKYIRFNGYGDSVEFGSNNSTVDYPDWSSWC